MKSDWKSFVCVDKLFLTHSQEVNIMNGIHLETVLS